MYAVFEIILQFIINAIKLFYKVKNAHDWEQYKFILFCCVLLHYQLLVLKKIYGNTKADWAIFIHCKKRPQR